jgi:hypothetical protein
MRGVLAYLKVHISEKSNYLSNYEEQKSEAEELAWSGGE